MKNKILKIFLELFLIISIIIGFVLINEVISERRKNEFEAIEDSNSYAYQIENVGFDGEDFVISGWFFELKSVRNVVRDIDDKKIPGIVLYDTQLEKDADIENHTYRTGIALNVEKNFRTDVNEYYKCEFDYSYCGFKARIPKSEINLKDRQYQVIIKPEFDLPYGICTETFINNGTLQYSNPLEKIEININDIDIDAIVDEGYCLANSLEYKFSIYQYGKKLYWIISDDMIDEEKKIFLNFQIDTTQFDKLPSNRIEDGIYWSIIGGDFETHEINAEKDSGEYRISAWNIPEDYSVTQILTGFYIDGQRVWQKKIRPVFLF